MGHGGGEEECWINPTEYMKFRNKRMMLKESFSKQLQKAHAEAQQLAAQETEEDDAVIEVSPKRKQSNSNWKNVYFKQLCIALYLLL